MKKIIMISFLLILILGCGGHLNDGNQTETSYEDATTATDETDLVNVTSFDLIDNADLPDDEKNTLRLVAGYTPEKLPKEYQSEQSSGRSSLQEAKMWLRYHYDELSPEMQKQLRPYYVSDKDPESVNYPGNDKSKIAEGIEALEIIPGAEALEMYETETVTIDGMEHFIYYPQGSSVAAQQAKWVKQGLIDAWKKHKELLGIAPSDPMEIFIVKGMSDDGTADIVGPGDGYCEIEVKYGQDEKASRATAAHELFHCFQFYIPLIYEDKATIWLMESTATWSEHNVYPDYNSEHTYLNTFFYYLGRQMIYYGKNREYGTYMWWYFLTAKEGPEVVKDMLFASKNDGVRELVTGRENFKEEFQEYMLWNWNQDNWKLYRDDPSFPADVKPFGRKTYFTEDIGKTISKTRIGLATISAKYFEDRYDNPDMIEYSFDVVNPNLPRYALIKSKNGWREEDWSMIDKKEFCGDEDIEKIVVVAINLNPDNTAHYTYTVDTTGECEPEWRGGYKVSVKQNAQAGKTTYEKISEYEAREVIKYNHEDGDFEVLQSTATWSSFDKTRMDGEEDCGMLFEETSDDAKGSITETFDPENYPPVRFSLELDDDDNPTGKAEFGVQAIKAEEDWITSTRNSKSHWKTCDYGTEIGYAPPDRVKDESNTVTYDTAYLAVDDFEMDVDLDSKRIQGSTVQKQYNKWGDYEVEITWDYAYG